MDRAARKAGESLLRDFNEVEQLQVSKKGPRDLVSVADTKAEEIIIKELTKARPDYGVVSEESAEQTGAGKFRWIIDPLDGTTNFLHGIPHFCISIALEEVTRGKTRIVAGLIYHPLTRDCYWAEKDNGAYMNGKRMKVSSRKDIEDALIGTGNSSFRSGEEKQSALMTTLSNKAFGIRCQGSAALDLAYVAAGKYDAYWQSGIKKWDMAAGMLMVLEAGGVVRDLHYSGDPLETGNMVASNSLLSPKLDKILANTMKKMNVV
jgi:myo-inositol-1(or 4)-monophosphatase